MASTRRKVVVIGAGAAGLAAIRALSKYADEVIVDAFEQSDQVGGCWIFDDKTRLNPMYENLVTNLPKEVMAYPDLPFPENSNKSFVGQTDVHQYLESYASTFYLDKCIKFRQTVIEVDPIPGNTGDNIKWNVSTRDELKGGPLNTVQYDAVIVCNGHYNIPVIPEIEGLDTFKGEVMHSMTYRTADSFRNKAVFVLGAGGSGVDIGLELTATARQVYLSHSKPMFTSPLPDNMKQVPGLVKVVDSKLLLSDGQSVDADVLLLATGYKYDYPFLSSRCKPSISNEHFTSIYRMLVDIKHPSLYFIGLCKTIVPFPNFYLQAHLAAEMITGRVKTPSQQEMQDEHDSLYSKLVTEKGKREKDFHFIPEYQWLYNKEIAEMASVEPLKPYYQSIYKDVCLRRPQNIMKYKDTVYKVLDSGDFEILHEPC